MNNERTIRFALILDGERFVEMLGYELPRIGEHLAVEYKLYLVTQVTRQYMTVDQHKACEEANAVVSVVSV